MHNKPHSEESKRKMSLSKIKAGIVPPSRKGCIPWNKGIHMWKNKKHPRGTLGKVSKMKGKTRPEFYDERHPMWKGDNVGYDALHDWVKRKLGTPSKCLGNKCKKISRVYEWCNISGEYKRELSDWIRLCRSCHRFYDKNNHKFI